MNDPRPNLNVPLGECGPSINVETKVHKVTEGMIADAPQIQSYIDERLLQVVVHPYERLKAMRRVVIAALRLPVQKQSPELRTALLDLMKLEDEES